MSKYDYEFFKKMVDAQLLPCAIFSVERVIDGTCGEIKYFAVNMQFKESNRHLFADDVDVDSFEMEGKSYTAFLTKEPKFEDICFKCAWNGEHFHSYINTTNMYGMWTENIMLPLGHDDDEGVGYIQMFYVLNEEMDAGRFSHVSPDIGDFVIKTCLEMRGEPDFNVAMDVITKEIREFTDAFSTCIMTVTPDLFKYDIISENVRNNELSIKEIFESIPYDIVESWEVLCGETDCIIIKDDADMEYYMLKAPDWIFTLRQNNVTSLCLVPFVHQNVIIGYLYITNFNVSNLARIKDTVELMGFFLTSEVASHMIMSRLEYLSTIDLLTGVYNRNCMNVNVDEMATKLKLNPSPFCVAFCDLNGLKSVNDTDGHDNGDELLKEAGKLLQLIFHGDKIYRSGGDEFTIISTKSSKAEFEEKIAALREAACDPEWLYFAIGYCCDSEGSDLRLALRYADEMMLKDKAQFYLDHPNMRR